MSADVCINFHRGNRESSEANPDKTRKAGLRLLVESYILSRGSKGATSDEAEHDLELPHQTVSARLTELKIRGIICGNGTRRLTRSGRMATVLFHEDAPHNAY